MKARTDTNLKINFFNRKTGTAQNLIVKSSTSLKPKPNLLTLLLTNKEYEDILSYIFLYLELGELRESNTISKFYQAQAIHSLQTRNYGMKTGSQIFFRGINGQTKTFSISQEESVKNVKKGYEYRTGIASHALRLIHGSKQLEDAKTLGDYDINKESTIHVSLSLKGD